MKTVHQVLLTDAYAAEAQGIVIAENPALRFFYQTWWVRWLPRFVFAVGIALCLAVGFPVGAAVLAGLLVLGFVVHHLARRSHAKVRRLGRTKGTTTIVSMDEDGIDMVGAFSNTHLQWEGLRFRPAVRPEGVLLKVSKTRGVWLPDRMLTEGTAGEVRQLVTNGFRQGWDDERT